ncbi:lactonase family protein [Pasteurella bettyae]|uniref:lactonase family protein n=1 Tax=Pasteurella bettyae TaxID=752 RepID=UPI003D2C753C
MKQYALTGCRTSEFRNARGKGIEVYEVVNNQWQHLYTMSVPFDNPSWLTFDDKRQQLYVIYGDGEKVSQFKFNKQNGQLSYINSVTTGPRHPNKDLQPERRNNPVCSCLTPDAQHLLIANHEGGNIAILNFDVDNNVVSTDKFIFIPGKQDPSYQDRSLSRPHQTLFDNSGKFMLVPNQGRKAGNGIDMVQVYKIVGDDYQLVHIAITTEGCWSRHICLHPSNKFIYCVNELDCTVTVFSFNDETGELKQLQEIKTLDINSKYDVSEIQLHQNGKFLYVSNRIHNSISLFYVQTDGTLKLQKWFESGGKTPRFTTLSPDNKYFYIANEDSDNIVQLKVNPDNGYLEPTGTIIANKSPTFICFI